jgi:hypothetical protein
MAAATLQRKPQGEEAQSAPAALATPTQNVTPSRLAPLPGRSALIQMQSFVSSPNDAAEREADRVAAHVVSMPEPSPSSKAGVREANSVRRSPLIAQRAPARSAPAAARPANTSAATNANIAAEVKAAASGGFQLSKKTRAFLEPRFRTDFSAVRLHTDATAKRLSNKIGARAFTYGRHIFFNDGQYDPDSKAGLQLLAHELTHTIQQSETIQRKADEAAAPRVNERTGKQASRLGISDALDYFADAANAIPGYRMFTILIGVNPINMSSVEASAANILRAIVEFLPGGNIITRVLDSYGVFEKVGSWIEGQLKSLGISGASIKAAINEFLDSLGWRDIFDLGGVWNRAKRIFTTPISRIISFAQSLFVQILKFVQEAVLRPLAALAANTPFYPLLKAVLGKDPVTGEPVQGGAAEVIGGFMTMIGQEELWGNIQRANAIPRAWAWFQTALTGLVGLVTSIPTRFIDGLKSLEIMDFVVLPRAFVKIGGVLGSFLADFGRWALGTVFDLLKIIIEVVAPGVMPYIQRAAGAFQTIVRDPVRFIQTLIRAAMQGFRQFAANFLTHLQASLVGWLTGAMGGTGVYIPRGFNLPEILKFVLSILGLTWANIRAKLVRATNEATVVALETGFDIVRTLVTEGPAAAWEKILEAVGNLKQMAIDAIMDFVKSRVVEAAVTRLLSMLSPAGAFIQAVIAIYNTVMFFVERLRQIAQVAASFIDALATIAAGNIAPAANRVEATMAGLLTLVISFLARIAGLGRIADAVTGLIARIRAPIDRGLDRVVAWIVAQARRLGRMVVSGARGAVARVLNWWRERRRPRLADGSTHNLYFRGTAASAELRLASVDKPIDEHLREAIANAAFPAAARQAAQRALDFYNIHFAPLKRTPPPTEVQIAASITQLDPFTAMLVAIGGATGGDNVATTIGAFDGPRTAFLGPISNVTSRGGADSSGLTGGPWDLLTARRMTNSGQRWVRMHMISAQYGGPNSMGNFIPAPSATNTGGVVRGFETQVQDILYGRDAGGAVGGRDSPFVGPPAANRARIWLETRSTGFHPAATAPDGTVLYGAGVFATGAQFQVGIYTQNGSAWVKNPAARQTASVGIDPPDFAGTLVPNINTAGPSAIAAAATVSDYHASEIVRVRGGTNFVNADNFRSRMSRRSVREQPGVARESTDAFNAVMQQVVAATREGKLTWR